MRRGYESAAGTGQMSEGRAMVIKEVEQRKALLKKIDEALAKYNQK